MWGCAFSLLARGCGQRAADYLTITTIANPTGENMTSASAKKLSVLLASVVLSVASAAPVFAQTGGAGGSPAPADANAANAMAASKPAATTKAERKAARKQAREKKNAELKALEAHGYQPSRNDPNYPTDLPNAQKKAGIGAGASQ